MSAISTRKISSPKVLGDLHFWDVIRAVAAAARREGRDFFTYEEWDWIFRTAEFAFVEGDGFPEILQTALARKRRRIDEARALGKSAEELFREENAIYAERLNRPVSPITAAPSRRSRRRYRGESAAD